MDNLSVEVQYGNVDAALRRLKRLTDKTALFKDIARHTYYTKPSDLRRTKEARARKKRKKDAARREMFDDLKDNRRERRYVATHLNMKGAHDHRQPS